MIKRKILWALATLLVTLVAGKVSAEKSKQPNILIVFTDDQGYADLGCFGSKENKTPVLDKLAKEGTKFTSFYAQPVCGPCLLYTSPSPRDS